MLKTRRKAIKSLLQEKIVNISDYRSLRTGRGPRKMAIVTADSEMLTALQNQLKGQVEFQLFDGRFSLEQALKNGSDYDGVVLDERMLQDDTLQICEKLKRQNKMEELLVLILSTNSSKEVVRIGFEKGCDEWVTRLDDVTHLARLLTQHLS